MNATHDLERGRHEITHAIHLEAAFLAMLKLAAQAREVLG